MNSQRQLFFGNDLVSYLHLIVTVTENIKWQHSQSCFHSIPGLTSLNKQSTENSKTVAPGESDDFIYFCGPQIANIVHLYLWGSLARQDTISRFVLCKSFVLWPLFLREDVSPKFKEFLALTVGLHLEMSRTEGSFLSAALRNDNGRFSVCISWFDSLLFQHLLPLVYCSPAESSLYS